MKTENSLLTEKVIVIDFGGQYNQLVARRVRECNVYCEIYSYKIDIEKIKEINLADTKKIYMILDNASWHKKAKRLIRDENNKEYSLKQGLDHILD